MAIWNLEMFCQWPDRRPACLPFNSPTNNVDLNSRVTCHRLILLFSFTASFTFVRMAFPSPPQHFPIATRRHTILDQCVCPNEQPVVANPTRDRHTKRSNDDAWSNHTTIEFGHRGRPNLRVEWDDYCCCCCCKKKKAKKRRRVPVRVCQSLPSQQAGSALPFERYTRDPVDRSRDH